MNEEKLYDEISRAVNYKENGELNTELLDKASDSAISYIVRFCIQYILEKHPYKDQSDLIERQRLEIDRLKCQLYKYGYTPD